MIKPTALPARYRIDKPKKFRLRDVDPADTAGLSKAGKERAEEMLRRGVARLAEMQQKLYAQNRWALLVIIQALDAAGKDGTIKHVMSGVNPQGCEVFSFKTPSAEDLNHDFLWRTNCCLPQRGRIGIFNRSYYEETLVVRVHPDFLARQKIPPALVTRKIWEQRFEDINALERYLARNGIVVLKFFLHVSKAEQKRRFLERLETPAKNWKFSLADVEERKHWAAYMAAYEDMIRSTSTRHAPWFVVPADNKWFTRLVVAQTVIGALEELDLAFPEVDGRQRRQLAAVRAALKRS